MRKLFLNLVILAVSFMFFVAAHAEKLPLGEPVKGTFAGELLLPSGAPVPNPGDTIKYDDGTPAYYFYYIGTDVYWAVRFTPTQACTVKQAHIATYYIGGAAPTCTLFVWDDNAGQPGTVVHSQTFTPSTVAYWNYINIGASVTFPASTDFWLGFFIREPSGADTTTILTDASLNYGDRSYVGDGSSWYSGTSEGFPGDLMIRAYVEYFTANPHDVGTDSITSPPNAVMPDSTYSVLAWVHNYGTNSEVFSVECRINPGGYIDSTSVLGLAPGASTMVAFNNWTVPPPDSTVYTMCVATLLGGDTSPRNDTMCMGILAVAPEIHDVGVDSIVGPPDTVSAGMGYIPSAWLTNHGNRSEIFQVFCEIDSSGVVVFSDNEGVFGLDPGLETQVAFATWNVPAQPGVTYNTCIWSEVTGDGNPANDTLCRSSFSVTGIGEGKTTARPLELALGQSVPNPFSGATSIAYEVPASGRVTLSLYDATGSLVRTLVEAENTAGYHSAVWDGRDDRGRSVPEGIYFCRLSLGEMRCATTLVLVR